MGAPFLHGVNGPTRQTIQSNKLSGLSFENIIFTHWRLRFQGCHWSKKDGRRWQMKIRQILFGTIILSDWKFYKPFNDGKFSGWWIFYNNPFWVIILVSHCFRYLVMLDFNYHSRSVRAIAINSSPEAHVKEVGPWEAEKIKNKRNLPLYKFQVTHRKFLCKRCVEYSP